MLWVISGIAIIVGSCFLVEPITNIWNTGLAMVAGIGVSLLFCLGFMLPFVPLIQNEAKTENQNMIACENIGGSYEVIDQVWNGKFYTDIYGCIK